MPTEVDAPMVDLDFLATIPIFRFFNRPELEAAREALSGGLVRQR